MCREEGCSRWAAGQQTIIVVWHMSTQRFLGIGVQGFGTKLVQPACLERDKVGTSTQVSTGAGSIPAVATVTAAGMAAVQHTTCVFHKQLLLGTKSLLLLPCCCCHCCRCCCPPFTHCTHTHRGPEAPQGQGGSPCSQAGPQGRDCCCPRVDAPAGVQAAFRVCCCCC